MFPATGSYALTERPEDISERQTVIWLILNACFWNPNAKNEMPFTLANYYLQEMLHLTFIQTSPFSSSRIRCILFDRSLYTMQLLSSVCQRIGNSPISTWRYGRTAASGSPFTVRRRRCRWMSSFCRSRWKSSTSIRTVSSHGRQAPAGALLPEVQWRPQGDDRCLRDQQGDRPVCPAVRCGPIIEVLFEEIFEIQRKGCTFVLTCYVKFYWKNQALQPQLRCFFRTWTEG